MVVVVPEIATEAHDADGMHRLRDEILGLYARANADRLDDAFYAPPRYWERLAVYASRDGFRLVTGRLNGELIGYALGFPLPAGARWWTGFRGDVRPNVLVEDGHRTFAVTEIMVDPQHRRRGYARALHDALLGDRPERRATLLVRPDNAAAQAAYASWGWHKLGELQPFADSPVFDAMVLDLPASIADLGTSDIKFDVESSKIRE